MNIQNVGVRVSASSASSMHALGSLLLLMTAAIPFEVAAHGGGLDACGGHVERKSAAYHIHDQASHCQCQPESPGCNLSTVHAPPPPVPTQASVAGNTQIESFHTAKKYVYAINDEHRRTLYCGCRYDAALKVDHGSCGYKPLGTSKRAHVVEWEHVVPAHAFGQSFQEWRDGAPACINRSGRPFKGRDCARKTNRLFRLMEADVYNLYAAIGEVNNLRSNYSMTEMRGEPREFGQCDLEIRDRKIEPRPAIRGDIARTYFYMDAAYPGRGIVSAKNRRLFEAWDHLDPVDAWECERSRLVAEFQGNTNATLASACREHKL